MCSCNYCSRSTSPSPTYMQEDLTRLWDKERGRVGKVQELKEQLDALKVEIEHAERGYNLDKAAELKYAVMPKLQVGVRMMAFVLAATSVAPNLYLATACLFSAPERGVCHPSFKMTAFMAYR